jgi:ligand-binding SRPBCC domain-containing protein
MELSVPVAKVFAFFSDAANLSRITPRSFGFQMITPQPVLIQKGTIIDYQIRVLGLLVHWRTLISRWDPPHLFVDEQLCGPYRTWVHVHRFRETSTGTLVEDEVEYSLPLPPVGELVHPLVRLQIHSIFCFRQESIRSILAQT